MPRIKFLLIICYDYLSTLNGAMDITGCSNDSVNRIATATKSAAQLVRGNPFLSIADIIINLTIWSTDEFSS